MEIDKKYIGVDIFSGAGGLSIGALNAGIHVPIAIEKDPNAAKTFERNHPESKVITNDIVQVDTESLNVQNPFIVFGGPPCQGFSLSNSKTRNDNNKNNRLYHEFVRFIRELNPKWFLFENVEGIVSFNKGETVKKIEADFEKLGYTINSKVLTASDYGVPQDRNRFILIGNREGIRFEFPKKLDGKVTVKEAIDDLPDLENGQSIDRLPYRKKPSNYAKKMRDGSRKAKQNYVSRNTELVLERYKHIKQGENWKAIPNHLMQNYANKNNCHSGIYK